MRLEMNELNQRERHILFGNRIFNIIFSINIFGEFSMELKKIERLKKKEFLH